MFVLAFFVVAGAVTLGGLYYAAHRLKQAVYDRAASVGVDLNSLSSPNTSATAPAGRTYKACQLLSQADAAAMLGEPIERIEDQGTTCLYWGEPGVSAKLAREAAADLMKQAQQPGATLNANDVTDSLSKIMGGLAAQAGAAQSGSKDGDVPLLTFLVDGSDGKPQMTALMASKAIFSGIGKGADPKSQGFGTEVSGLGDRAVRIPPLGLNVLQGNALIRLIPGPVPDANEKSIAIARAILPKL